MSDDIERIPSMRKPTRQGVPKRKPRDVVKPATPAEQGKTKDAPRIQGKQAMAEEPTLPTEREFQPEARPSRDLQADLAAKAVVDDAREPVVPVEPEPQPAPEPEPQPAPPPEPVAPEPFVDAAPQPEPEVIAERPPLTMREMVARVDAAWAAFRARAFRFPAEHMDDHLFEDGWTRKQMLAHVAAWHDLTADRLVKLALTGKPAPLDRDVDGVNALAARVAIGKTAGEVLEDVESTFNRLRRQMVRLNDAQLRMGQGWAAMIIAGNTYEHYAEHIGELTLPEPPPGSGPRR